MPFSSPGNARWSRLGWRESLLLAEAMGTLAGASLAVRLLPFRWLVQLRPLLWKSTASTAADVVQLRWAIETCARHVPFRALCIEQALCLRRMMHRRGIRSELHYGIKFGSAGELKAHVWLSVNARIVIGGEAAGGFARVATFVD